jgi:hypothetical protein
MFLVGVMAAGGCGGSKTYEGPNGEKMTVSKDGKSVVIQSSGKDGSNIELSASEKGIALPGDFPKDVPVYTGATVLSSAKANDGMMVTLQTPDEVDKVAEFYEKNLKDQGWTTENTVKMGEGSHFANKKEKRSLNVSISGSDKTMIVLIVGQEK